MNSGAALSFQQQDNVLDRAFSSGAGALQNGALAKRGENSISDFAATVAHSHPAGVQASLREPDTFQRSSAAAGPSAAPPFDLADTFKLHSYAGSDFTIYLDFDGHVTTGTRWNNATRPTITSPAWSLDADRDNFSDLELETIQNIFLRVSEDFAPFDVNVTTEEPDVERLRNAGGVDTQWGVRVVTTIDFDDCSCGGFAYLNSFDRSIDEPAFVFNVGETGVAEAITHEVGHTLGLRHDGKRAPETTEYYSGHGSGQTDWAPIMGSAYGANVTTWSNGDYYLSSNTEDDLAIITSQNGFDYRVDDHADGIAAATAVSHAEDNSITANGVIERNTDVDYFSFDTGTGDVSINIDTVGLRPNLDVWAGVYDANGVLVAQSNGPNRLSASFQNLSLTHGTYYLKIDGVGTNGVYNAVTDSVEDPTDGPWTTANPTGYSDYGSLGQYFITGNVLDPDLPDLAVQAFDVVQRVGDRGGAVTANWRVRNIGDLPAGEFDVGFYISTDEVIDMTNDRLIGTTTINSLNVNGIAAQSTELTLPGIGDSFWDSDILYSIGAIVTYPDEEYSKENNISSVADGTLDELYVTSDSGFLKIVGTEFNDNFIFNAGQRFTYTLNGKTFDLGTDDLRVSFNGLGGTDAVFVAGGAGNERASIDNGQFIVAGDGYLFKGLHIESAVADGGDGNDIATIQDTAGNDIFVGTPTSGQLTSNNILRHAIHFERVTVNSSAGGTDTATLSGTRRNDLFIGRVNSARMTGPGYHFRVNAFTEVTALASVGTDRAIFKDTIGNDSFVADSNSATFSNGDFLQTAVGFDSVNAYSENGGSDSALLIDSHRRDTFASKEGSGFMRGFRFANYVRGFHQIMAQASEGGRDIAILRGGTRNDRFISGPLESSMRSGIYTSTVTDFELVKAFAGDGGNDTALIYDTEGDDHLVAREDTATFISFAYRTVVSDFSKVKAFSFAGGEDELKVYAPLGFEFESYGDWG